MSLLADLLAKVKNPQSGMKDVPPGLREIVSTEKNRNSWKLPFLLILLAGSVAAGILTVRFAADMKQALPLQVRQPVPARPPTPAVAQNAHPAGANRAAAEKAIPVKVAKAPEKSLAKSPVKRQKKGSPPVQTAQAPAAIKVPVRPEPKEAVPQPVQPLLPRTETPKVDTHKFNALIYSAQQYEKEGNTGAAMEEYRQALRMKPGDSLVLNALACLYIKLEDYDQGLRHSLRSLETNPGYAPAMVNAGICKAKTGETTEAERLFTQAMGSGRFNREAMLNLGFFYEREKKLDSALPIYERLAGSGDHNALLHVGRVLELAGKTAEAKAAYTKLQDSTQATKEVKREAAKRLKILGN